MGRCMCTRIHGGKKVICKKWNLSALSGILGHFKSEFRKKKRKVVIFPITSSGRVEKSQKKKKKIFFKGRFPLRFSYFL